MLNFKFYFVDWNLSVLVCSWCVFLSVRALEDLDCWITICIKLGWSITIYLLLISRWWLSQSSYYVEFCFLKFKFTADWSWPFAKGWNRQNFETNLIQNQNFMRRKIKFSWKKDFGKNAAAEFIFLSLEKRFKRN